MVIDQHPREGGADRREGGRPRALCRLLASIVLALALTPFCRPAAAQTTSPVSTTDSSSASSSSTPSGAEPITLPPVIITGVRDGYAVPNANSATRSDTPLIEIPQAIQVLNRTLLEDQDRRTLADALVNVSGVTPTKPEEVLFASPIVRGFAAEIYQDGLPMYGATQTANDPTSLVGTERVEVVKGPTSALYGGGLGAPLGGLINVVSKQPEAEPGGFVAFRTGSFSTLDGYADLNAPLGDKVAARLTAEDQDNGSWIDRVKGDRTSVRPSVSFQFNPDTKLLMLGQFDHRSQLEYSGLPAAQALAGRLDRYAFPGATSDQPRTTIDNQMMTVTLEHEFNDDQKLTVSGRHYTSRSHDYGSFIYPELGAPDPATPTTYPIYPIYLSTKVRENTFDSNLLSKVDLLGGHHEFLGGIDYDYTDFVSDMWFDGNSIGSLNLTNPNYTLSYAMPGLFAAGQNDGYRTIATYLQDQATYGRLHLTGSLRYTQLKFSEEQQNTDRTYYHVTPRVGATVDLVTGLAAYAGYSTGFRAPFGFLGLVPPKPETSRNYEGGLKFALKNIGLSGAIAAFEQTRDNVATPDPNNALYSIQTGEQRARGLETDLVWELDPSVSLLANYAHTDAKVTKDNSIPIGNKLPRVPSNSGRLAGRYRVLNGDAEGLSFGAGITAFGRRELTLPNTVSVPGYAVVDAQAAYDFGRYTIELSAVNLTGRHVFDTYEYLSFPVVMPIQPRSAYVTVKARF